MMELDEKKQLVVNFLKRCNDYADGELAKYQARLEMAEGQEALELADRISHWAAYRAFNEHAIEELATARLDDWLV